MGPRIVLVVDTGSLYAAADRTDRHHRESADLLEGETGHLFVPILVVAEVAYLLAGRLGADAENRFLAALAAGEFLVEPVRASDWGRILELVTTYRDLDLGTVDASVVATAERLGVTRIATLDRRHFPVVRPAHVPAFELLP